MTISDFIWYCTESFLLNIKLYDLDEGCIVWSGRADEIPRKYEVIEIQSFDPIDEDKSITFNI